MSDIERKAIAAWMRGGLTDFHTDAEYSLITNLADAIECGAYLQGQSQRHPTQSDIEQEIQQRIKDMQEQETFSSVRSRMKFRAKGQALSDLLGWIRKEQSK